MRRVLLTLVQFIPIIAFPFCVLFMFTDIFSYNAAIFGLLMVLCLIGPAFGALGLIGERKTFNIVLLAVDCFIPIAVLCLLAISFFTAMHEMGL